MSVRFVIFCESSGNIEIKGFTNRSCFDFQRFILFQCALSYIIPVGTSSDRDPHSSEQAEEQSRSVVDSAQPYQHSDIH